MRSHRLLPWALGLVLCPVARAEGEAPRPPRLASPPTLETVVVTGSRATPAGQDSFDLPGSITALGPERLGADTPRVNLSEALAGVPGLTVLNRQNYAQDLQVSSRGFGARSAFGIRGLRLLADGIPATTPDGQGQAATFNLDRAGRVEVLRGPLSVLYGNHGGGVIQVITPEGKGPPTADGQWVAGSQGLRKADVGVQGEAGGVGYVADASHLETDGYRTHSAARRDQRLMKLSLSPTAGGQLTLTASSFRQQAEDPLGQTWNAYQADPRSVAGAALNYNTRKSIDQRQGGIRYQQRLGDHQLEVSAYTGTRSVTQYQAIPQATQQAQARSSGGIVDFDRDYSGLAARWSHAHPLAGGQLTASLGLEYDVSQDDRRGFENFLGTTLGVAGRLRRAETDTVQSFDQYAALVWQGTPWTFSGGLRHSRVAFNVGDRYLANGDDSGALSYGRTTPTLSALYGLDDQTNLYVSAARGFETPTFNELFYSGPGGGFGFNLQAADSTHLEVGLKRLLGEQGRLEAALFQVRTANELVVAQSTGGQTAYRNAAHTRRQGLELAWDQRWSPAWQSRLAYTHLQAIYDEAFTTPGGGLVAAGKRLPGIPADSGYAELLWQHQGGHVALEGVVRSKLYVEDSNQKAPAPGYALANLRLGISRALGSGEQPLTWTGFVRVDNLFDRRYIGSVIVGDSNERYYEAAPGRTWVVGMSLKKRW